MHTLDQTLGRFDLSWQSFNHADGLAKVDAAFLAYLASVDARLMAHLEEYRIGTFITDRLAVSTMLCELGEVLDQFLAELFGYEDVSDDTHTFDVLGPFRDQFVARRARRYRKPITVDFETIHAEIVKRSGCGNSDTSMEYCIACYGLELLEDQARNAEAIETMVQWAKLAQTTPEGRRATGSWLTFRLPKKIDPLALIAVETIEGEAPQSLQWRDDRALAQPNFKSRQGFALSDQRADQARIDAELAYCKYCHDHEGDFCSRGFLDKKGQIEKGFRQDAFGQSLEGCPLEEKISEMQWLKKNQRDLGALAMAMADNPMIPATGHRICNDCMKSCIYQKQDPVDIPQIETRILTDVLARDWGVEIYHLLRRWNPLRQHQYRPSTSKGYKVLVVGMGPAGFSLAHHLLMEGCTVVGIDGLKIEPIDKAALEAPIQQWADFQESLDERRLGGFGGVAEYGITARWDKNFLKLIQLSLEREAQFAVYGGVRFGGAVTIESAWTQGFDHISIATGAGYPKILPIEHSMANGMRQANDFLMSLQLTGAAKSDSLASLEVGLPAVVIGGGLTAVDTATEVGIYYLRQIEKLYARYQALVAVQGETAIRGSLTQAEISKLDHYLTHAQQWLEEKRTARDEAREPDSARMIRAFGGVTIIYRKTMEASPAYTRNHQELEQALQEGVYFRPNLAPMGVEVDDQHCVQALRCAKTYQDAKGVWQTDDSASIRIPAASVLVAAGTSPNIIYAQEHPEDALALEGDHYLPHQYHDGVLWPQSLEHVRTIKQSERAFFTSYQRDGRLVSFVGDAHPQYQGSVVKAIASAQHAYPDILRALEARQPRVASDQSFIRQMRNTSHAEVAEVICHASGTTELLIRAPAVVAQYQVGQLFRLQTYEYDSRVAQSTRLQVPIQTVSGAGVIGDCVRLLVFPGPGISQIMRTLSVGQSVVLVGPSGGVLALPENQTVVIMAYRWGVAMMLDVGQTLKARGNRVVFLGIYGDASQVDLPAALEASTDQIIWVTQGGDLIDINRDGDMSLSAQDPVEAILASAEQGFDWQNVDHVHVLGGARLLMQIQAARDQELATLLSAECHIEATVGTPMQCKLKGVCGQCVQWLRDPQTGERTKAIFSCAAPEHALETIDLDNMAARQRQNRVMDKINTQWISQLMSDNKRT